MLDEAGAIGCSLRQKIKALLASGLVSAGPDLRGIDRVFLFSALPGAVTCFEGGQLLTAGRYLQIAPANDRGTGPVIAFREVSPVSLARAA